jgi:hypothetical protein
MNLHPADFDPTPVLKRSIIQAPIMYPDTPMSDYTELGMAAAPAPQMYMGSPLSSGAELSTAAPAASFPEMAYSSPSSRLGAPR